MIRTHRALFAALLFFHPGTLHAQQNELPEEDDAGLLYRQSAEDKCGVSDEEIAAYGADQRMFCRATLGQNVTNCGLIGNIKLQAACIRSVEYNLDLITKMKKNQQDEKPH